MKLQIPSPLQKLESDFLCEKDVEIWLKRDDLIHPEISGNKWRKLKFNIEKAKARNVNHILTFGGAFSNHIAATAAACHELGLKSTGVIRGERPEPLNPTLQKVENQGMQLVFVDRESYRHKSEDWYVEDLRTQYGPFFLVPEGGANFYGVMGCMEISSEVSDNFDYWVCPCGTGTTLTGLAIKAAPKTKVLGFPALKGGDFILNEARHLLNYALYEEDLVEEVLSRIELNTNFHFGGYARVNDELVRFINDFFEEYKVPLDLVYTSKMMYGLFDMIRKDKIPKGSKLAVLHTGGLQGNEGMKSRLGIELNF